MPILLLHWPFFKIFLSPLFLNAFPFDKGLRFLTSSKLYFSHHLFNKSYFFAYFLSLVHIDGKKKWIVDLCEYEQNYNTKQVKKYLIKKKNLVIFLLISRQKMDGKAKNWKYQEIEHPKTNRHWWHIMPTINVKSLAYLYGSRSDSLRLPS